MEVRFSVSRSLKKVFYFALGFEILIVLLDIFITRFRWIDIRAIRRMTNITREDSIGTWFSSTQMLVIGIVLLLIAIHRQKIKDKLFWGWYLLAGFFSFMAVDDAIKFHERVGTAVKVIQRNMLNTEVAPSETFFPSYTWQLVFGPFFFGMGLFMLWFLQKELRRSKVHWVALGGLAMFVLAVAFDFVEGLDNNPYALIGTWFDVSAKTVSHYSKLIEEFIEMLGSTFFLVAFLKHFLTLESEWRIKVVD